MTDALVIGGEGFIGRHLCRALQAGGQRVVVVGRPKPGAAQAPGVARVDLTDRSAMTALFAAHPGADLYYLAATTRRTACTDLSDVHGGVADDLVPLVHTLDAAAAAVRPPRVVVRAGTIAEYGFADRLHTEDDVCRPSTVYGATLLAGTAYLSALANRLPFPVTTARLGLTYGAGQSPGFLAARLLSDLSAGRSVTIARPQDRRSMVHVDDVVAALLRLAAMTAPPAVVNISAAALPTMQQLAVCAAQAAGAPHSLLRFGPMPGPPNILAIDPSRARDRLGWVARLSLQEGLARSVPQAAPAGPPQLRSVPSPA